MHKFESFIPLSFYIVNVVQKNFYKYFSCCYSLLLVSKSFKAMLNKNSVVKYLDPRVLLPIIFNKLLILLFGLCVISVYLIIILASIPMYLFRFALSKYTKHFKPELGKMVTARGQFLAVEQFTGYTEKSPRSNVLAAMVLEGFVSIKELKELVQRKVVNALLPETGELRHPELKQFVTSYMGYKYWKPDPNFKIENHVKLVNVPENDETSQNEILNTSKLNQFMETLLNQTFHPNRSPWEFILVHNYRNTKTNTECNKNNSVLIVRFHHCLTDGYGALYSLILGLMSEVPSTPKPQYASRGYIRYALFCLTFPFRLVHEISHFVVLSMKENPWKIKDDKKAWKLLYEKSVLIPTSRMKEIKNRFGVSFTSVVHSCLSAAIEKCLVAQYGAKKAKQCSKTTAICLLPLPNHPHRLRNYCTGACIQLPTVQMDAVERLQKCEDDVIYAKKSTMPFAGQYLPVIGGAMFSELARLIGKNRSFPVSISNFSVGEASYECAGHRVIEFYTVAGCGAGVAGLGFLIYSYKGGIQVGIVGEKAVFTRQDLKCIAEGFVSEVDSLYSLATV